MTVPASVSGIPGDLVELGRIVSAYGVQGWVKIQPFSAEADVLRQAKNWWCVRPVPLAAQGVSTPEPFTLKVQRVRSQGSDLVAQLAGLNDRDQAEALKGVVVSVSRAEFPAAEEDEVYWVDLIGCEVYGKNEQDSDVLLGHVLEVLDNGVHGVLKVGLVSPNAESGAFDPVLDAKGRQSETLVPYVAAHVQSVDLVARRIVSDWPSDF